MKKYGFDLLKAQNRTQSKEAFTLAGGFSVACNEVKCANVTTKRNERNFLRKFLKWSYQVVTARKIQDKGFTLAEVLITLAIIGVVAAVAIPSVISNSQQQEFKTGLRKAVSVLNQAITMNMALDGETPYDNANLMGFLMKHMAVIKSTTDKTTLYLSTYTGSNISGSNMQQLNAAFYTTDGMRFEIRAGNVQNSKLKLYETGVLVCGMNAAGNKQYAATSCGGCGSYGLNSNSDNTTKPPCLITVDVNGDRKPNPQNASCKSSSCVKENVNRYSDATGTKLTDLFSIMITDKEAIPYGVAAQRAMYQAQK